MARARRRSARAARRERERAALAEKRPAAARVAKAGYATRSLFARLGDALAFGIGRLLLVLRVPLDALLGAVEELAVRTHGLACRRRRLLDARPAPGFLVVGHRGSPAKRVENTLPSFEEALADGANAIEVDLCLTKDGEVVLWHDEDPDALVAVLRQAGVEPEVRYRPVVPSVGSDLRRPVRDLTLAELRAHCGYVDAAGGGRVAATIPTFAEFAAWAAEREDLDLVFLDLKIPPARADLVDAVVAGVEAALTRHPGRYEIIYLTPSEPVLRALRARAATAARSLDVVLPSGIVFFPSKISAVRPAIEFGDPCASVGRPTYTISGREVYRRVIEADLERLRRHNEAHPDRRVERLVAWTVNDAKELRALVSLGVHAILTDHPALLRGIAAVDRP
jgi:glycerophosphoryl diester phosphodiesterase